MGRMMKKVPAVFLALAVLCLIGCRQPASTPARVEAEPLLVGTVTEFFPHSVDRTHAAADAAVRSMGLVVIQRDDVITGKRIVARRADNTDVIVHLDKRRSGTEVRVRVGLKIGRAHV